MDELTGQGSVDGMIQLEELHPAQLLRFWRVICDLHYRCFCNEMLVESIKAFGDIFPPVDGEHPSILYILVNNFDLTRSMAADITHCIVSQLLFVYPVVRKRD